jgi:hypothetical protein
MGLGAGGQMIENDQSLKKRLENIMDRIKIAALSCGRKPESVRLVAVSKTMPTDRVPGSQGKVQRPVILQCVMAFYRPPAN